MGGEILAQLSPQDTRLILPQPRQTLGVEGLHAVFALVLFQHPARRRAQYAGVAPLRLQLHDHRSASCEQGQHLLQQRDSLLRALQPVVLQLLGGQILNEHIRARRPQQRGVVEDGELPVPHQMHVQLRTEAVGGGALKGGKGVLRYALLPVVEPPVGVPPLAEVLPVAVPPPAPQAQQVQQKQHQQYNKDNNNSFHGDCSFEKRMTTPV